MNVPPSRSASLSFPSRARDDDVRAIRGDLLDRLAVGVADDRDDEPARRRDREADVRRREAMDLPVDEVRIDRPVAYERRRDEPREHVGHRRLRLALAKQLDHPLARRDELGRVRGDGELEDRRLPRLGEAARDRLARRRQLDDLDLGAAARLPVAAAGAAAAFSTSSAMTRPSGPVPASLRDVDAALAGDPPRERARLHALARRARGDRSAAAGSRAASRALYELGSGSLGRRRTRHRRRSRPARRRAAPRRPRPARR